MKTSHITRLLSLTALIVTVAYLSLQSQSPLVANAQEKAPGKPAINTKANLNFAPMPLAFEANQGQARKDVKFISRGAGYNLLLTANEAVLALQKPSDTSNALATLQMSLLAANRNPTMSGIEEMPGKTHFFVGSDPKQWRRNIANYAKVKYASVYPGIDLLYYGNQSQFEYDFIVQPGADPKAIQFTLRGARKMWIDAQGDLVLETSVGEVRQHKPVVYQEIKGERKTVAGEYILKNNRISFAVGAYDPSYPLVIDPVISYATFLNASSIARRSIAVDSQGNAYLTGTTSNDSFTTTVGALNQGAGQPMAFVTKLSQDGSWPVYTAVFGGTTEVGGVAPFTSANAIAVDAQGNAYVAGSTNTGNFPTTANAYKKAAGIAGTDAYVLKLNPTGSEIVFATLLGGSQEDTPTGLVLDAAGNPCLVGTTSSSDFPNTDTRYKKIDASVAAFVVRLSKDGSSLLHANMLDSASPDRAVGIAIDPTGNLYVTGTTTDGYEVGKPTIGTRFPRTAGVYDFGFYPISPFGESFGYQDGVFVAKVGANGKLVYSTVVGQGQVGGIVADHNGNVFVVGRSNFVVKKGDYGKPDFQAVRVFPETDRTFVHTVDPDPQYGPLTGGMFLVEMNTAGDQLLLSHRIEADSGDGYGIAIDQQGYLHITGGITLKFPVGNGEAIELENLFGLYPYTPANRFAFYLKVDPSGKSFVDVEFLRSAVGRAIAVDIAGNAYVSGTAGAGFNATTPNAYLTKLPAVTNPQAPFVAKFGNEPIPGAVLVKATASVSGQITDKKGSGLAGTTVKISSERLANPITQVTDQDGKYAFPNLPKGANYSIEVRKAGYELNSVLPSDRSGGIDLTLVTTDQVINFISAREPSVAVVNAANFQRAVAVGSIASAFGSNLAPLVKAANTKPLPNTLAFVSVFVTDSQGNTKQAPLFYVSPTQVNFQIPEGITPGEAEIQVNAHGILSLGTVVIDAVAPGIFSADSSGRGLAAAGVQSVLSGGKQTYSLAVDFNPLTSSFTPIAIDVNSADQVYLVLYGTGLRWRTQLENVRARIGGQDLPVSFAGAQEEYVGVDQINILLPKTLVGKGNVDIELTVDGKSANMVKAKIK